MISKKNYAKIQRWLFEYSGDMLAGNIEPDNDTTIGSEVPIAPAEQMSLQLTRDLPPIEDAEYTPATIQELSAAADIIASKCPQDQINFFYSQMLNLLEKAIDNSNRPDIAEQEISLDDEIKRPIIVQKEHKTRVANSKLGYIIDVDKKLGDYMKEARYGARQKDSAKNWKQGDDLDLYRGDDDFDDDIEFHPDAEDLKDFMAANEMGDGTAADVYGATPETAEQANQEYSLADILKSKVYPSASRESAITNKLEREIYPVLRAVSAAPQVSDRLTSLVKSDYAVEAFLDSMYHADLLSDKAIEELRSDKSALQTSELFKYFNGIAFVRPTMRELQKLEDIGAFDFKKRKSQISPDDANRIMKAVKAAWERKSAAQKSKIATKAARHMTEFESRDKSVMG